ncbi:MAG TPA: glycosyltransferase family 2 protein [Bacillota bacterium]|nr:glycosyltransferase family 2 protein [Bacillota bacterium]
MDNRYPPHVSLIIPTIRQVDLVERCIKTILKYTSYAGFEIIVVDNGSDHAIQTQLKRVIAKYNCRLILQNRNTGFAAAVNRGAMEAKGDFLVLINNDIEFFSADWLQRMLQAVNPPNVGIVGARLLYPDGRIQHAGVRYVPALKSFDHIHRNKQANYPDALLTKEALAVTGALMLVKKELWRQLGGMSEEFFIAMEDVDFCLRARKKGWRVVYCGCAVAYHMEGKTRGTTPENKVRYWYLRELEGVAKFRKIWFDAGNTPLFETEV